MQGRKNHQHSRLFLAHALVRAVPHSIIRRDYWVAKLERNTARDKKNRRRLRREGWRVLVVWECQTQAKRLDRLRKRVADFLNRQ